MVSGRLFASLRLISLILVLSLASSRAEAQSGARLHPGRNDIEFDHQGRTRTAVVFIPRKLQTPADGWPLVLMLHGAGGSARNVISSTGWPEKGESAGLATVFPNGTPKYEDRPESFSANPQTWNSGAKKSLSAGELSANAKNVDDVGFLSELLDRVRRQASIDPKRIYVAGHSNGAEMAFRFGCERSDIVAAVGVMAGHFFSDPKPLLSPVSLIQIVGDQDPFTPIAGGKAGILGRTAVVPPALQSVHTWVRLLGLKDEPDTTRDDDKFTIRVWGPTVAGSEVKSIIVKGHGHAYLSPLTTFRPRLLFGPTVNSLDATETIWSFFADHPKR